MIKRLESKQIKESELLSYYSVIVEIRSSRHEVWKAETEKDAKNIISFLSKFNYVWGNSTFKPKLYLEKNIE